VIVFACNNWLDGDKTRLTTEQITETTHKGHAREFLLAADIEQYCGIVIIGGDVSITNIGLNQNRQLSNELQGFDK